MTAARLETENKNTEWLDKLQFLESELASYPQDDQRKMLDKINRLKKSVERHISRDGANYLFITEGLHELETDVTKYVWKMKINTLRIAMDSFPAHIKSSFNARFKPIEANIKKFKLGDGSKNSIDGLLDQLGEDINIRLKAQLDAENVERKVSYVTRKPDRTCWLFRCFQSAETNPTKAKEMEDVTMRLLGP